MAKKRTRKKQWGGTDYTTATMEEVFTWLQEGVFTVHDGGRIYKGTKLLSQRIHKRKGMDTGDLRVDLRFKNRRRSVFVSQVVWMVHHGQVIPPGFEIHHIDEDPFNNDPTNLVCVFGLDHHKLHNQQGEEDEVPF